MSKNKQYSSLERLNLAVTRCKRCPRLAEYIRGIPSQKPKRHKDEKYWARPVPSLGDPKAGLLIVGLAPAAHGGNRTGRMFTGDSSGNWLAAALYQYGFASKNTSTHINDGFELTNAYVTAAVRCAPPANKPLPSEIDNCSSYMKNELELLPRIKVVICLGRIAFDSFRKALGIDNKVKFGHGVEFCHGNYTIICSYHPSRQNTQTGRLKWESWTEIFQRSRKYLESK